MAKRHKGPERGLETEPLEVSAATDVDADMIRQAISGNAAFQASIDVEKGQGGGADFLSLAAGEIGQSVASSPLIARILTALRDVPREASIHGRLVQILEGSSLERRGELISRLERGRERAIAATSILEAALGPLSEEGRSHWAGVFEGADAQLASADATPDQIATAVSGGQAVAHMCAAILRTHRLDEEEDEVSGMDYATEESGA